MITKTLKYFSNHLKTRSDQIPWKELKNQKSLFDIDSHKTVQITGLPRNWKEEQIQQYFDPKCQMIDQIISGRTSLNQKNGLVYLIFQEKLTAEQFIANFDKNFINTPNQIEGLRVKHYELRRNSEKLRIESSGRQVELYNLPYEVNNAHLIELIEHYSSIEELQLPKKTSGLNKGYALLTFKNEEVASEFCRQISGLVLFGRELKTKIKNISFVTQKERISKKSDFVYSSLETQEITIRGSFFKNCYNRLNSLG